MSVNSSIISCALASLRCHTRSAVIIMELNVGRSALDEELVNRSVDV